MYFQTGSDTPTMGELNKYLIKYCELWRSIGYKLGLEDDVLTVIQSNHPMQMVECFREVLQKWLKQDVRPTWSTLELAITNARRDELGLGNLVEGKMCLATTICCYTYSCVCTTHSYLASYVANASLCIIAYIYVIRFAS